MQTDSRLDAIEKRLQLLEERLSAIPSLVASKELQVLNEKKFMRDIDLLSAEIGISERPQFYVGAIALTAIDLPSLFEAKTEPLVRLFDEPVQVRQDGFGLYPAEYRSMIVEGDTRRAKFNSQIRQLSSDGRFTALFRGDDNFLGWALRKVGLGEDSEAQESEWRINSLVLAEATYECVSLAKKILKFAIPQISEVQFFMGYRNMLWNGKGPLLLKGKADRNMYQQQLIPSSEGECLSSILSSASESAERTSLRLIADVYHLFGLMDENIPYSVIADEGRIIDPSSF